jgi:hypothetical protein
MATQRTPPRFVPTLTEVVQTGPAPLAPAGGPAPSADQIAQRVLQRVDLSLDRRLREEMAKVILEHSEDLAALLRERLEAVVRQLVADAVAEEIQARQR